MKAEQKEIIQYHIDNKMIMSIKRESIEDGVISGFPLYIGNDILVLSRVIDFRDDGIVIIKSENISDAYSRESDSFYEMICRKEGVGNKKNPFLNMQTMKEVLIYLSSLRDKFVIVQCEKEQAEHYFSMGLIEKMVSDSIEMKTIDRNGVLSESLTRICFNDITLVAVDDYYSKMYFKYMKI